MKKNLSIFLSISFLFTQFGCATIRMDGRKEVVSIRSNPTGARVSVDGVPTGITPFEVALSHKSRHEIKFQMPGYQEAIRYTDRTFNWWIVGNIFLGAIPAVFIDLAYGNQHKFDSDVISALLTPQS